MICFLIHWYDESGHKLGADGGKQFAEVWNPVKKL